MFEVVGFLYIFLLLVLFLAVIFIIYHISKFSLNKNQSISMITIFLIVLSILLIINIFSFTQMDKDTFSITDINNKF